MTLFIIIIMLILIMSTCILLIMTIVITHSLALVSRRLAYCYAWFSFFIPLLSLCFCCFSISGLSRKLGSYQMRACPSSGCSRPRPATAWAGSPGCRTRFRSGAPGRSCCSPRLLPAAPRPSARRCWTRRPLGRHLRRPDSFWDLPKRRRRRRRRSCRCYSWSPGTLWPRCSACWRPGGRAPGRPSCAPCPARRALSYSQSPAVKCCR